MIKKLYKFPNGATLIYRKDKRMNYSAVEVGFICGSIKNEKNGVAHMLEHMLFKKTKNMTLEDLDRERSIITTINASTGRNSIFVHFYKTNRLFNRGLKLAKEMLVNVEFDEDSLETEKNVVKEEYKRKIDKLNHDGSMQLSYNFTNTLMPEQTLGNIEDIDALTVQDLENYKSKHFTTNNFVFAYCGNYSFSKVKRIVEKEFLKDLRQDEESKNTPEMTMITGEPNLFVHQNDDRQLKVLCAFRCDFEKLNYFYEDMASLLHRYMSKGANGLRNKLRNEGLVYASSNGMSVFDNEKDNAFYIFEFSTGDTEKLKRCFEVTKEAIESIIKGEITDEEFEDMVSNKIYSYDEMHAPPKEIRAAGNVREYIGHGKLREIVRVKKKVKRLKSLTKADFIKFASDVFKSKEEPYVVIMSEKSSNELMAYEDIKKIFGV